MGFITSIRNLVSSVFQGIFGPISDRIGRKLLLLIGLALSFVITTILIFVGTTEVLIISAIVQSFAVCIFTPSWNASLGDVTDIDTRASYIGKLTAAGQIFSVSATIIAAIFFYLIKQYEGWIVWGWRVNIPWQTQYAIAFAISAVAYAISIIAVLLMKETNVTKESVNFKDRSEFFKPFKNVQFRNFLIVHIIFCFMMSLIWPLTPMIQISLLNMEIYHIAIVSATFAVCMGVFQVIGGRLADRIGRKKVIIIGASVLLFFPVSYIPAIVTGKWWLAIFTNIVAGTGSGLFYTTINTYILDLAKDKTNMGSFVGWKESLKGISTFLGSLSAGFIVDALIQRYDLVIAGVIMSVAVSILRLFAYIGYYFIVDSMRKATLESDLAVNQ